MLGFVLELARITLPFKGVPSICGSAVDQPRTLLKRSTAPSDGKPTSQPSKPRDTDGAKKKKAPAKKKSEKKAEKKADK